MCSLVMSLFSHDYIKTEIGKLKYQQCFNLHTCVHRISTAPGFLDGKLLFSVFYNLFTYPKNSLNM